MCDNSKYQQALENIQATIVGMTYLKSLVSQVIKQLPAGTSPSVAEELFEEKNILSGLLISAEQARSHVFSLFEQDEDFTEQMSILDQETANSFKEIQAASGRLWTLIGEMHNSYIQNIIMSDVERDMRDVGFLSPLAAFIDEDYVGCGSMSMPTKMAEKLYHADTFQQGEY